MSSQSNLKQQSYIQKEDLSTNKTILVCMLSIVFKILEKVLLHELTKFIIFFLIFNIFVAL